MEEKRYNILTRRLRFCCARKVGRQVRRSEDLDMSFRASPGRHPPSRVLVRKVACFASFAAPLRPLRFRLLIRKGTILISRRKCNIAIGDAQIGDGVRQGAGRDIGVKHGERIAG